MRRNRSCRGRRDATRRMAAVIEQVHAHDESACPFVTRVSSACVRRVVCVVCDAARRVASRADSTATGPTTASSRGPCACEREDGRAQTARLKVPLTAEPPCDARNKRTTTAYRRANGSMLGVRRAYACACAFVLPTSQQRQARPPKAAAGPMLTLRRAAPRPRSCESSRAQVMRARLAETCRPLRCVGNERRGYDEQNIEVS